MRYMTGSDERVVLALLVPLLPNLETLHFASDPFWDDLRPISTVIKQIALRPASASPPLSKLHTVSFGNKGRDGFDLTDIARFVALPSVRYVRATCVPGYDRDWAREDKDPSFEREEELPLSKVELCTFTSSRINVDWARILVAGIEGPCVILGKGYPYTGKPWQFHIIRKTGIAFLTLDNVETINLDDFRIAMTLYTYGSIRKIVLAGCRILLRLIALWAISRRPIAVDRLHGIGRLRSVHPVVVSSVKISFHRETLELTIPTIKRSVATQYQL